MKTLAAAAALLSFTMILGAAMPARAALNFICEDVNVNMSATVNVPPCIRSDDIDQPHAGCVEYILDIGGDCSIRVPHGTAYVSCLFSGAYYAGFLHLSQSGDGIVTGWGNTTVPFTVDVSGEYRISFEHGGSGTCGGARLQIHGPDGLLADGYWSSSDGGIKSLQVMLLTGLNYDLMFRQEGETSPACPEVVDQIADLQIEFLGSPERVCCDPMTGGCDLRTCDPCLELNREWHPEWTSCSPNPCPQPMPGATLQLDQWFEPEPWHAWVSALPGSVIPVHLDPGDLAVPIDSVRFYYSTNSGASWQLFGIDHDGAEPWFTAPGAETEDVTGDGWHADLTVPGLLPPTVEFKVLAYTEDGVYESRGENETDGAPPYLAGFGVEDWEVTDRDTLGVGITEGGTTITRIIAFRSMVGDVYTKGVPGFDQHLVSAVHCVPAAAAQCLKYFELHGDYEVTGGLDSTALIASLGAVMKTNPTLGTQPTKWATGLSAWIHNHGNGYTVRAYQYLANHGLHTWTADDWLVLRNELERSQDVMVGILWEGGGGHALTLNSITNPALPSGRYLLGFKDPWDGESSTGELDTAAGDLYDVTGAGGGQGAYIAFVLLACPREMAVETGGPGLAVFDGLPPGGPPYVVPVPLEERGLYAVHFVVVNSSGHAWRTTRLVVRESTGAAPEQPTARPMVAQLNPPVPNPFRTIVQIPYTAPAPMPVSLAVFDVTGRKVRILFDGPVPAGSFRATWDGRDERGRPVASGMYYVKLRTPDQEATQTVILMR